MRPASFTTDSTVAATPEEVFGFVCDLSRWPLFRGWGPLPGIAEATLPGGGPVGLGSRIRVRNDDGSVHHEVVVAFEPPRLYAVRMELVPPASWLMARIDEEVRIEPAPGGARITRRFAVTPRSRVLAPVARLIAHGLLARAVARHDAAVRDALRG